MIIIINGSIGVGKTTISWKINHLLYHSVMLDGDYLTAVNPFDLHSIDRIIYLYKTIALLIKFHQQNGFKHFVINYVFENEEQLNLLLIELERFDENIYCCLLYCEETAQKQRIEKRNNNELDWELKRALELNHILAKASEIGFIGERLNTTNLTKDEVATVIVVKAQQVAL